MTCRLGVVSFLNARPLVEGLSDDPRVRLTYGVPSRLPALLDAGSVDAALVPIVDVLRSQGRYRVISDACIGSDGETMTVRVFSQVPPDRIRRLAVDSDSHTSVALARVIFRELYERELELHALDARATPLAAQEAVLLIGDKVVDPRRSGFAYEMDLGGAWRAHTGLPFVFAVWATHRERRSAGAAGAFRHPNGPDGEHQRPAAAEPGDGETRRQGNEVPRDVALSALLSSARDHGLGRAAEIARTAGPELGWMPAQAERYLTRCLTYTLDARHVEGANLFARLCGRGGVTSPGAEIHWPGELQAEPAAR